MFPKTAGSELRALGARVERPPRSRQQHLGLALRPQRGQLPLDLVGIEKIVRVEPLDVVAAAKREGSVPRRRRTTIRLLVNANASRFVGFCHTRCSVGGTIVDDDDFLVGPGLSNGRRYGLCDPALRVIRGDQDRNERR